MTSLSAKEVTWMQPHPSETHPLAREKVAARGHSAIAEAEAATLIGAFLLGAIAARVAPVLWAFLAG